MSQNREIKFEKEARNLVLEGINEISRAVAVTLGAKGKNVIIGDHTTRITKDGVTVARAINFEDPYKKIGADMIKEVASNTCDATGDGTTTAAILAQAIIYHGLKHVEAGASPISLKRGMDIATKAVVESMQSLSRPCNTKEEIRAVAIISANNDEDLGGKVAEVMSKVGADGVIDIQTSETSETTIDSIEGMKLDSGFISPYLITEPSDFTSRLEKPYLLITDMKITSLEKMIPIMELAKRNSRPLFIIGSEFGGDALTGIVANHVKNNLRMCAIKPPGMGINQKEILEDLAILTGGEVLTDQKGIDIDNINLNLLGSCERIITDKLSAIVVGGDGDKEAVEGRKENIRKSIKAARTEVEKSNIKDRLARMENGVAIIRVGANSETELSEKRDRIEDSVGATTAAMDGGIVPGGGVALALAGYGLLVPADANDDVRIGMMIIKQACEAPIRQLAKNCGVDSGVVYNKVIETGLGYNALTNKYEDLLATGVIDPLLVPKIALQNAVSVASLFLTTDCIIVDKK
ncbi:MAG TPA: chaperonin GroEL [Bacteroidales bacterium]|nr:chaperonin GroEL [Bacteroidales bacterium]